MFETPNCYNSHEDIDILNHPPSPACLYFDLLNEREQREISDIYLIRLEQFYPFPALSFIKELSRFKDAEFVWCQEEPKNQGGWSFVEPNLEWSLNRVQAKYKRARYIWNK